MALTLGSGTKILNVKWHGQKKIFLIKIKKKKVEEGSQWETNLLVWMCFIHISPAWSNPKNRSCLYSGIRAQKLGRRPTWVPCLITDHNWPPEYLDILTLENWRKRFGFPADMAQEGSKQPRGYGDFGWLYYLFVKVLPSKKGESLKNNSSPKKEKQTFFSQPRRELTWGKSILWNICK